MNSAGGDLFERVIDVEIGSVNSTKALSVSDLHIDFSISDGVGVDSTASVTIYNLSKNTYEEVQDSDVITIRAGHKNGNVPQAIFIGKIESVTPEKTGGDVAYKISCTGGTSYRSVSVSKTYGRQTSVYSLLIDLARVVGIPLIIDNNLVDKLSMKVIKYEGGVTVHGKAVDEIREIARDFGLEMRIDSVSIVLIEVGKSNYEPVLSVDSRTGLLTSLKPTKVSENGVQTNGYSVRTVLFPEIKRGSKIRIADPYRGLGVYRVVSRSHSGSNYSNNYHTTCKVVEVK